MSGGDNKKTTITPLSELADFYYHPDDNIEAVQNQFDRFNRHAYERCV